MPWTAVYIHDKNGTPIGGTTSDGKKELIKYVLEAKPVHILASSGAPMPPPPNNPGDVSPGYFAVAPNICYVAAGEVFTQFSVGRVNGWPQIGQDFLELTTNPGAIVYMTLSTNGDARSVTLFNNSSVDEHSPGKYAIAWWINK